MTRLETRSLLFRQPMRFELSVKRTFHWATSSYCRSQRLSMCGDSFRDSSLYTQLGISEGVSWSLFSAECCSSLEASLAGLALRNFLAGRYQLMWFQEPSDSGSPGQLNDSDALLTSIVSYCLVIAAWPTLLAWPCGWIGSSSAIAGRYRRPPKETRDW